MTAKNSNVFSEIIDVIGAFDDLNLLDRIDALTGTFKARRRTNKQGISNVKATFIFKDDIISSLGLKNKVQRQGYK